MSKANKVQMVFDGRMSRLQDGIEYPDPTPIEIPTRLKAPGSQVERMRELIRAELSRAAREEGMESFEEADDFSLDGEEWVSPYENEFEPPVDETTEEAPKVEGVKPNGESKDESPVLAQAAPEAAIPPAKQG